MNRPGLCSIETYLKLPREAETWLLKPLIPSSGAALLYGDPKVGKSYLALQLAAALSGDLPDFLGFPVHQKGPVGYLQLDTPRSIWGERLEDLKKKGAKLSNNLLIADRESLERYPFDILQPGHMQYLFEIVQKHSPVAVIVDTLRESHSGDEDSSTVARNVIANLVGATYPSALILISHGRKPNPDADRDLLADHRGSSYITGRMDAIMRLTKSRLYYTGRSIEAGDIKIQRMDSGLWEPIVDDVKPALEKVLMDSSLSTMRAKARTLGPLIQKSEEAAMSLIRRHLASKEGEKVIDISEFVEEAGTPTRSGA